MEWFPCSLLHAHDLLCFPFRWVKRSTIGSLSRAIPNALRLPFWCLCLIFMPFHVTLGLRLIEHYGITSPFSPHPSLSSSSLIRRAPPPPTHTLYFTLRKQYIGRTRADKQLVYVPHFTLNHRTRPPARTSSRVSHPPDHHSVFYVYISCLIYQTFHYIYLPSE